MRQEEIVNEIRRMCGEAIQMPFLGWHFMYNGQVYVYATGRDDSMIRLNIPFVVGIKVQDHERLSEAVNATNRDVKYVKAMLLEKDRTRVSLDYDHKLSDDDSAKDIVPHIIKALDFAARYLMNVLDNQHGQQKGF